MTEQAAIEKAIEFWEKRVIPPDIREVTETAAIQTVAMFYLNGFEIVPAKMPTVTMGGITLEDIERMKADGINF
jgi:thiamine monophosphate synthase